ncbi:CHAT domain-containing protein, partial [Paracoccaceae bacterium]|nr:CHAT domain-containing protein [Paracoccaceae bacterium]
SKARRLIVRDFKSKAQDGKVDVFDSIRTLLLLAEWNESNGNQDNIIKIYQEIISNSDFLSQSNNPEFIDILNIIAWKLIYLGQYSMVEKVAALSINHLGNEQEFPAEYYNILGGSSLFSGHYLDAEKYFLKAANIELQIEDTLPTYLLLGLGGTYMRLGDYDTSISYLEQAISTETFSKYTELEEQKEGYLPLSLSYWYGDKYNKALNSIRELSRLASKALSIRNRTGMSVWNSSTEEIFALHAAITLNTKNIENRQSLLSEGFESAQLVSQTSTASATAQMAARFASKSNAVGYLVRQQQDVRAEILSESTRLNQTLLSTTAKDQNSQVLLVENSINLLEDELKQINQAISARFPRYQELVNSKPLSAKGSQSLLSPNEALFTFISEKETEATYAFLVRKDGARAYKIDLSEAQLGEMVAALRSDIDLSDVENIAALPEFDLDLAHDLYSKLLGPAADMLDGVEHLLVVPTGPMESLPLNLLVTEPLSAEGSDFKRYQSAAWLPKRFSVTRLPSVSSLRALRVFATNTQATEPFKGFGDPVLEGAPGEVRGLKIVDVYEGVQANTDKVRGLPELPETSGELRRIAKYLNSSEDNLYLRERATETELKSADLSNSRVLGFATHGLVGGELNGLAEPALVLTPPAAGSDLDDGLLKASEVAQLKLNADMVLLSACNTASGENLGAEGLSGLARAFIYAGARSLLVSHWSVDSGSAAELTTGLFEALDTNPEMGRAEALQSSMMSLASDSENPHYSHPAFWAPFSLIGEGAALN